MSLRSLFRNADEIDGYIVRHIKPHVPAAFTMHTQTFPAYRFVDLYNAIDAVAGRLSGLVSVNSEHGEDLISLMQTQAASHIDRSIRTSSKISWMCGPDEEVFLPVDRFWVGHDRDKGYSFVMRLRYMDYLQNSVLEVAANDVPACEALLQAITRHSTEHSIYRNHVLTLSFEAGTRDEYGDIEKNERFRVLFLNADPVGANDLILDDEHQTLLQRNVIDLYKRRDILKAFDVPLRRGVLLYGPPGTGKTFTSRYLCSELPGVTRIFVTGSALANVGAIFALARLLQPSLLFLEDVDLIFSSRDISLYSTTLGDMLDQMDGLRANEEIGVILTTNSIERLESAIKDRPGRISQCIYFGAPRRDLRMRYLQHHLRKRDTSSLDFAGLADMADGATQAFLKEWVHRAVQIATERLKSSEEALDLTQKDFSVAIEEMQSHAEGGSGRIIGFSR